MFTQTSILLLLLQFLISVTARIEYQNGFTSLESQRLKELRGLIEKDLNQDYMKNDIYLIRYLRARDLNVEDTKEMMLKTLKWRRQHNIDELLNKTLEIEKDMPYIETKDRIGRPVASVIVGDWKVRRQVLAGRSEEMLRGIHKLLEYATYAIRKNAAETGKEITQAYIIVDLNGFTRTEHGCIRCMPLYLELFTAYEAYYPYIFNQIITVNTPRIFNTIYSVIKPVLSKYTQEAVTMLGYDKTEWRNYLLKIVPNDQLPRALGGTFV